MTQRRSRLNRPPASGCSVKFFNRKYRSQYSSITTRCAAQPCSESCAHLVLTLSLPCGPPYRIAAAIPQTPAVTYKILWITLWKIPYLVGGGEIALYPALLAARDANTGNRA